MRLHEVMGEYEDVDKGRFCEELGFCMACIHYQQHTSQRKAPQLAPIAISENHLKFAATRTVRCSYRVEHFSTGWRLLHGAYMGHKIPIETVSPEGRGQATTRTAGSRIFLFRTVHCRSRSHRLRSLIVAMALATLATSQIYRPGDFSYVTIKTGEIY